MWANILLTGGNLAFSKRIMKERCAAGFADAAPPGTEVNITQSPDVFDAWRGASALAGMDQFRPLWVLKAEYEEHGAELSHKRCM